MDCAHWFGQSKSHQYKNVLFDINYSKKFLKNGGLIIGDDYEIKFSDVDFNILNGDFAYNVKFYKQLLLLFRKLFLR
jgi:hypothetical protein